MTFARVYTVQ